MTAKKNARERRFIDEYTLDGNATQAAIRAGYSPKTAHVQGCQLLKKHKTAIEIKLAESQAKRRTTIGITLERLIRQVACGAFVDMGRAYDKFGNPLEIPDMPLSLRRALTGFEFYEEFRTHKGEDGGKERTAVGVTKKFKFVDQTRAQRLLAELLGFLPREKKGEKDDMTLEELVLGSFEVEDKKP